MRPYFTNYVKAQLIERRGARDVYGGGLRVTTTIDLELQERAREAIAKWLPDADGPEAALVAIEADTGDVVAMVGGRNFRESQFNLAVQGARQPGSAFKPFVLATALEQGISPATTFESKPLDVFLGDSYVSISNYEDAYLGTADLTTATVHSDNSVYTQLTQLVGPKRGREEGAKRLGVTSPLNGYLSIGLGGEAVNPLELARAYVPFANGGYRIDQRAPGPLANRPARDQGDPRRGRRDDRRRTSRRRARCSPTRTVAIVDDILQRVVEEGTGTRAALPRWQAAGKTGTTENYGDAWFVGYTPEARRRRLGRLSDDAAADADRVPRRRRRRRHVPGADLEELHGARAPGARAPSGRGSATTAATTPFDGTRRTSRSQRGASSSATGSSSSTTASAASRARSSTSTASGPRRTANCQPNEVDVPSVVGMTLAEARDRLGAAAAHGGRSSTSGRSRCSGRTSCSTRTPPRAGSPRSTRSRSCSRKALHGLVPDVEGDALARRAADAATRKLQSRVRRVGRGTPGTVVSQKPPAAVAAEPG